MFIFTTTIDCFSENKSHNDDSDDMYDEIDRYHQSRDTLHFNDDVGSGEKQVNIIS